MYKAHLLKNPFKISRQEIQTDKPIQELIDEYGFKRASVFVDDQELSQDNWGITPADDAIVTIRALPEGETGNAEVNAGTTASIVGGAAALVLATILTAGAFAAFAGAYAAAASVAAVGAAYAGLAGSLAIAGSVATTGLIAIGAGAGLRGLYSVLTGGGSTSTSDTPALAGGSNGYSQWGSIPVIFGHHRIYPPNCAQPYTVVESDEVITLTSYLMLGYGDISISELKIGDTLASSLEGITYNRLPPGVKGTLYPTVVKQASIGKTLQALSDSDYEDVIATSPGGVDSFFTVDLSLPNGIFRVNDDGDINELTVWLKIQYRPKGATAWANITNAEYESITKASKKAYYRTWTHFFTASELASNPTGAWEIRVFRTVDDSTDSNVSDDVVWSDVKWGYTDEPVSDSIIAKTTRIELRINATEKVSGTLSQINLIAQMNTRNYDGSGSGASNWVYGPTSNPAACMLYLLTGDGAYPSPTRKSASDSKIDWPSFEAWWRWCNSRGDECNYYYTGMEAAANLATKIGQTARAALVVVDGKYSIVQDVAKTSPVMLLTPRNSWGFAGQKNFNETADGLRISYVNAVEGYSADEFLALPSGVTSPQTTEEFALWGITSYPQAYRDAMYRMACARLRPETYTIYCDVARLVCTRGDMIRLQHDVPMIGISSGRVKGVYLGDGNDGLVLDDQVYMEAGKTYGLVIYKNTGVVLEQGIQTVVGNSDTVLFSGAVVDLSDIEGAVFAFGELGTETLDCIVVGIAPADDYSAQMTLVEAAPAIHSADTGEIPDYQSSITQPGNFTAENIDTSAGKISTDSALIALPTFSSVAKATLRLDANPSSLIVPSDFTGTDIDLTEATVTLSMMAGTTDVTDSTLFTATPSSGISGSFLSAAQYRISGLSVDSGIIEFSAIYAGVEKTLILQVSKIKAGESPYQVEVISTKGLIFRQSQRSTILQAIVWRGDTDVTASLSNSQFRWIRQSNDTNSDATWNATHYTGFKTVEIFPSDFYLRATYTCEIVEA